MPSLVAGSVEWFKWRKQSLISHARALDSVAAAKRSVVSLLAIWDHPDPQLRADLHTAAVIEYARPFSSGKRDYPLALLKKQAGFDRDLHSHLVDLRNKLIAHHDSEYLKSSLVHQVFIVDLQAEARVVEIPIGASVGIVALHSIDDRQIAHHYAGHFDAAITCISAALEKDLSDLIAVAREHPDNLKATFKPDERGQLGGVKFGHNAPLNLMVPTFADAQAQILRPPQLSVRPNGYLFRTSRIDASLSDGEITIPTKEGDLKFELRPVANGHDAGITAAAPEPGDNKKSPAGEDGAS